MHQKRLIAFLGIMAIATISVGCATPSDSKASEMTNITVEEVKDVSKEEVIEVPIEAPIVEIVETGISINTENAKLQYLINESVDFSGVGVNLNYSDNSTKPLMLEECELGEVDTSSYGIKEVTVKYGDFTETFEVDVIFTVTDCEPKTMYSKTSLNVRSGPATSFEQLGVLNVNDEAKITGTCDNGWSRIDYKGQVAYTSTKYLSDKKIEVAPPIDASGITWIGNVSKECRNKAISLWGTIPQNVKNAITTTGYQMIVTTDPSYTDGHAGTYYPFTTGYPVIAVYAGSVGKVNIAVVHEVGHFVDDYVGRKTGTGSYLAMSHTAEFQQIYAEEVGRSGYPGYATDCLEDYFAEAFWHACVSPGTTKANLPRTYEYVMRVASMC